jgi:hypothetical protein
MSSKRTKRTGKKRNKTQPKREPEPVGSESIGSEPVIVSEPVVGSDLGIALEPELVKEEKDKLLPKKVP